MHITLFFPSGYTSRTRWRSATPIGSPWWQRANPVSVNLGRHGSLKKLNRNYQPAFALHLVQNAFHPSQGPALDQHPVAQFKKWPRHYEQSGLYHPPDIFDLVIGHRRGNFAETNQLDNAWRCQHRQPIGRVQPAKHITWKEKLVHLFRSIRPAALSFPRRRELLVTAFPQMRRRDPFVVGTNPDRKPWIPKIIESGFRIVKHYLEYHSPFVLYGRFFPVTEYI
jgi:hypothetical protein